MTMCPYTGLFAVLAAILVPGVAIAQVPEATALQFVGEKGPNASIAHLDLGDVDPIVRPTLRQTFRLRNASASAIRVTRLQASCGCTSALINGSTVEDKPVEIAPGAEATLQAVHDFYIVHPGQITKYIWIYIDGNAKAAAMVELKLNLRPCVRYYPESLVFGKVSSGEGRTLPVRVEVDRRLLPETLSTSPVPASSDPDITVERFPAPLSSGPPDPKTVTFWYQINLAKRASLGVHFATLSFPPSTGGGPTVDPKGLIIAQVSAGIQAVVEGRIIVKPAICLFGQISAGKEEMRQIQLEGKDDTALSRLTIEPAAPWLSARVIPARADSRHATLEVRVAASAPTGSFQTQIRIRTSDGQRLNLPVSVYIVKAPLK